MWFFYTFLFVLLCSAFLPFICSCRLFRFLFKIAFDYICFHLCFLVQSYLTLSKVIYWCKNVYDGGFWPKGYNLGYPNFSSFYLYLGSCRLFSLVSGFDVNSDIFHIYSYFYLIFCHVSVNLRNKINPLINKSEETATTP